jgi:nucleoside-diphosphate-sugar epimerase
MKILVTGASGFVGKHAIQELEKAHELRLFSRRHPRDGRERFDTKHPFMAGDLRDRAAVRKAVEGMDAVAHIGANPWFSPETFDINANGVYNVLEAMRESGVKRCAIAGSDWGVDKSDQGPVVPAYVPVDEAYPCRPHDHYGLSKVVGEQVAEMYSREHGLIVATMRITGVWRPERTREYGREDRRNAAEGAAQYWWSYVDVRDVARAFRMAIEAPGLPPNGAYFLTAPDTVIDEPTMEAVRRFWPGVRVNREIPGRGSVLSWENARKAFGWEPVFSWKNPGE